MTATLSVFKFLKSTFLLLPVKATSSTLGPGGKDGGRELIFFFFWFTLEIKLGPPLLQSESVPLMGLYFLLLALTGAAISMIATPPLANPLNKAHWTTSLP